MNHNGLAAANRWAPYLQRYQAGEWRDRIFRDLILTDAGRFTSAPTLLDVGCGRGFDDDPALQQSLVEAAGRYIGIEPDLNISPVPQVREIHRSLLEDAPVAPSSVDVGFAVMVLEHVAQPQRFWNKVHEVLRPGGVFWAFTIDSRHWFCAASLLLDRFAVKDLYLDMVIGRRGSERYENYPVYYRSNRPGQIVRYTRHFTTCECINFGRVGQLGGYIPRLLKPAMRLLDRVTLNLGQPGTLLAIRAVK